MFGAGSLFVFVFWNTCFCFRKFVYLFVFWNVLVSLIRFYSTTTQLQLTTCGSLENDFGEKWNQNNYIDTKLYR